MDTSTGDKQGVYRITVTEAGETQLIARAGEVGLSRTHYEELENEAVRLPASADQQRRWERHLRMVAARNSSARAAECAAWLRGTLAAADALGESERPQAPGVEDVWRLLKAYLLKEFGAPLVYRYEGAMLRYLQKCIDQLRWQRLRPFEKLASMLLDHLDGILNYCRTKAPPGVVEAVSGNIKGLLRRGRGYKKPPITCC